MLPHSASAGLAQHGGDRDLHSGRAATASSSPPAGDGGGAGAAPLQHQHQQHQQQQQQQHQQQQQSATSHPAASGSGPTTSQPRIRRRNRLITSCLECRRRKLKCDKLQPCTNCTRFSRDCLFLAPALDQASQQKLAEIKEKMGTLERTLEEDIARKKEGARLAREKMGEPRGKLPGQDGESEDEDSTPEDERDLEATPLSFQDATYAADIDEDIVDLGVQIGKMRVSDRIGGFFRPRMFEEMADAFRSIPGIDTADIETKSVPSATVKDMLPDSDHLAPASSFFFAPPVRKMPLFQYLPSKGMADALLGHYWSAVHPICKVLHRPSFERQYNSFWQYLARGAEARPSFMALTMAVLFTSVISKSDQDIMMEFGVRKHELQSSFQEGAEQALSRAHVLRTTRLETLQAFVMYLIPLCRSQVSRVHVTLTATAIRLALCMGLHRDGTRFGLPAVETHVRRLVWYQLCFLDIRTCEACGPRPQIRADDYDTCFPLNVDDAELEGPNPPEDDQPRFTDNTLIRVRFECNEMTRLLWFERPKVPKRGTVTITSLLGKVEKFRGAMEKTYYPIFNHKNPLHFFTMQVYNLLTYRMHIAVLHLYSSNAIRIMPDRLRNVMMSTGTLMLEHAITIETNPALKQWSWYAGALNQWHIALLLMGELYAKPPQPRDEARIWRCLDYAFELPSPLSPAEKGRLVLGDLQSKTAVYQKLHMHTPKLRERSPTAIRENTPSNSAHHQAAAAVEQTGPAARTAGAERKGQALKQGRPPKMEQGVGPPQLPMQPMFPVHLPGASSGASGYGGQGAAGFEAVGAMPTAEFQMSTMPGGTGDAFYAPPVQQQQQQQQQQQNMYSPASHSEASSNHGGVSVSGAMQAVQQRQVMHGSPAGGGDLMLDIDWNEWDRLFPLQGTAANDLNIPTNDVSIPPFSYPETMGGTMGWQQ